jgi:hypothetical protein
MRIHERLGAALVSPRAAFAEAEAGRGGTGDAAILALVAFVCAELPALVQAAWTGLVSGFGPALGMLAGRLSGFVGHALIVWAIGGVAITVAAGRRRRPGRDFELAAVAFVPYLVARLGFALLPGPTRAEEAAAAVLAAGWVVAAILFARRRRP